MIFLTSLTVFFLILCNSKCVLTHSFQSKNDDKSALTTICVKITPTDTVDKPYIMCPGRNLPPFPTTNSDFNTKDEKNNPITPYSPTTQSNHHLDQTENGKHISKPNIHLYDSTHAPIQSQSSASENSGSNESSFIQNNKYQQNLPQPETSFEYGMKAEQIPHHQDHQQYQGKQFMNTNYDPMNGHSIINTKQNHDVNYSFQPFDSYFENQSKGNMHASIQPNYGFNQQNDQNNQNSFTPLYSSSIQLSQNPVNEYFTPQSKQALIKHNSHIEQNIKPGAHSLNIQQSNNFGNQANGYSEAQPTHAVTGYNSQIKENIQFDNMQHHQGNGNMPEGKQNTYFRPQYSNMQHNPFNKHAPWMYRTQPTVAINDHNPENKQNIQTAPQTSNMGHNINNESQLNRDLLGMQPAHPVHPAHAVNRNSPEVKQIINSMRQFSNKQPNVFNRNLPGMYRVQFIDTMNAHNLRNKENVPPALQFRNMQHNTNMERQSNRNLQGMNIAQPIFAVNGYSSERKQIMHPMLQSSNIQSNPINSNLPELYKVQPTHSVNEYDPDNKQNLHPTLHSSNMQHKSITESHLKSHLPEMHIAQPIHNINGHNLQDILRTNQPQAVPTPNNARSNINRLYILSEHSPEEINKIFFNQEPLLSQSLLTPNQNIYNNPTHLNKQKDGTNPIYNNPLIHVPQFTEDNYKKNLPQSPKNLNENVHFESIINKSAANGELSFTQSISESPIKLELKQQLHLPIEKSAIEYPNGNQTKEIQTKPQHLERPLIEVSNSERYRADFDEDILKLPNWGLSLEELKRIPNMHTENRKFTAQTHVPRMPQLQSNFDEFRNDPVMQQFYGSVNTKSKEFNTFNRADPQIGASPFYSALKETPQTFTKLLKPKTAAFPKDGINTEISYDNYHIDNKQSNNKQPIISPPCNYCVMPISQCCAKPCQTCSVQSSGLPYNTQRLNSGISEYKQPVVVVLPVTSQSHPTSPSCYGNTWPTVGAISNYNAPNPTKIENMENSPIVGSFLYNPLTLFKPFPGLNPFSNLLMSPRNPDESEKKKSVQSIVGVPLEEHRTASYKLSNAQDNKTEPTTTSTEKIDQNLAASEQFLEDTSVAIAVEDEYTDSITSENTNINSENHKITTTENILFSVDDDILASLEPESQKTFKSLIRTAKIFKNNASKEQKRALKLS
ncbi:uncharacterized protein LOC119690203 isoform X2 [Teleopsis dalmanni]|uniref:uncharacterized protein LOC119690203 isoform X2 n=1 Tax=Teleopsis dalmanni TaxID=139649 RepID=UPI0018CE2B3B|nr:uncharacterized protein LOC119690203 isoform X2 [Teleopsis dalmanni]